MKSSAPAHIRQSAIACILLAALLACGCVHPRLPLIADLSISGLDTGCLKDKIITIDPGHGGPERGAIGVRGITEAEINLTVALHLWGLLKQAGARPILTRTSDQSLYNAQEFNLAADLALRKKISGDAGANLFISIHHNASLNRSTNNLIVFYAMADPYQSRDAARSIGSALQHSLDQDSHSIQAGNYTVLRASPAPAILGEASFISNKKNELELAYTRTLATEARGYFNGILAYFSKGVPMVRDLKTGDPTNARPAIRACLDPGQEHGSIDINSITATVDEKDIQQIKAEQNCIELIPPELANGQHRACIAFRNTQGNSAQRCIDFAVALPPHNLEITSGFSVIPPDPRVTTAIDIFVRDRLGRPVLDGTPVAIRTSAGTLLQAETSTTNGHARAMLAAGSNTGAATLQATSGSARAGRQIIFAKPEKALLTLSVRDAAGQPIEGATLIGTTTPPKSDPFGCIQAEIEQTGHKQFHLVKQGYEPYTFFINPIIGSLTIKNAVLQPIDAGVFFNRTIMLDPQDNNLDTMPVLIKLKDKIEHAGGRALLTWQTGSAPAYRKRIMQSSTEAADVFLCVNAESRRCSAGHYHRSAPGLELAQLLQKNFSELNLTGWRKFTLYHSTHDAILHTSMPAVELSLPRKLAAKNPDAAAQAIYEALRQWLSKGTQAA